MKRTLLLIPAFLLLGGCNGGPNQTNIELITNMMDQDSVKSQDWVPSDGDKVQMRMPPDGAISRGNPPYKYLNDPAGAEKQPNPLAGNMSPETLSLGHKTFEIYCALCHGDTGNGQGRIAEKMAVKPRNLLSDEAKAYPDGRIYFAITAGKGVMGNYSTQITDPMRRWAVVNYVRSLQRQIK
jgi:mono/diheme cytochrome c family protein